MSVTSIVRRAAFLMCAVCVFTSVAAAGSVRIGDELARRWSTAAADDFLPVLVYLRDRVDIPRDLPQLAYGPATLQARHALLIDALKKRADATGQELTAELKTAEARGAARRVHRYWLDNIIGLYATPAVLAQLAKRDDVERIEFLPKIEIDEPISPASPAPMLPAGHETNLDDVGAPAMWSLGLTGKGRLVCNIDTGVRGSHAALSDRWRGRYTDYAQAWFDPRGLVDTAMDIGTLPPSHGSHTMGIMIGADKVRGDTVGIAPDAEWIAAFGIGSVALDNLDLIACLQWAADPDGDPNTTQDVPDVLNCSWGFTVQGIVYPCNDMFDGLISNLEAAGIVVIWSAGNEGPLSGSIRYPANSTNAYSTNFSVGNWRQDSLTIFWQSSRGPSPCAFDPIKPELVAPGYNIRSVYRATDTTYGWLTGTSMAAPHVAGAATLLRQMAPQATPQQIKQALFVSAIDKGPLGEDNTYGNGLLDIPAAAESLLAIVGGPELDVRVEAELITDNDGILQAGDTVSLLFRLANRAQVAALETYLKLGEADPYVAIVTDSTYVGLISPQDTATAGIALRFEILPGTPPGTKLDLALQVAATGYSDTRPLVYYTDPAPVAGQFTHDNTLVKFTVTNYGQFGMSNSSYYPLGGAGFIHGPSITNNLAEGALVIGTDVDHVSDAARRSGGADKGLQITDHDFSVVEGGAIVAVPALGGALETTESKFDDHECEAPIGITVTQRSLIFPRGDDESYVMLIYTLENTSFGPISGLRVGILHDWDFPSFLAGTDTTDFDATNNIGFMFDRTQITPGHYRGVAVLSPGGATAFRSLNPQNTLYDESNGEVLLTDTMKWGYLSGGIGPASVGTGSYGDAATFIGAGPFDLPNIGDTVQVAFAFVGSETGRDTLLLHAQAAKAKYDAIVAASDATDPVVPRAFRLDQNYPNPFNPETKITFSLARPEQVKLVIYNILGQQIRTLLDRVLPAGEHAVLWDGRDSQGAAMPSGVYFYKFETGSATQTRKMLLLR